MEAEFEKDMRQYNLALANREDQKAATLTNVLNANIQQRNQRADQIWQDNVNEINKWQPTVVGDRLVTYQTDPNDPTKKVMNSVQLGFGPQAAALVNNAQIGMQMGSAMLGQQNFQYQSQQTAARTALGLTVSTALATGNGQAATEGLATQAAMQANALATTDQWRSLFDGNNTADDIETRATVLAYQAAGVEVNPKTGAPTRPLDATQNKMFLEKKQETIGNLIFEHAARLGQIDRLLQFGPAQRAVTSQRARSQTTTERSGPKGTTRTSSWSLDE
jgi:hypothetical protein